ncbi:hypothetical protein [Neoroseomonas lacus]|nr:hypothetical protein [Neoroseomonas lacus]
MPMRMTICVPLLFALLLMSRALDRVAARLLGWIAADAFGPTS